MIRAQHFEQPDDHRTLGRERDQGRGPGDMQYLHDLALAREERYREVSDLDAMTWPVGGHVVRVAGPKRHGELLRAAEREQRRLSTDRGRALVEVVFCVTAILLTAGWIGFLALCANRWLV